METATTRCLAYLVSFLSIFALSGLAFSCSVLSWEWRDSFDHGPSLPPLMAPAVHLGLHFLGVAAAAALHSMIGHQLMLFLGGVFSGLGLLVAAFSTSFVLFFVAFSVVSGLGGGLCVFAVSLMLSQMPSVAPAVTSSLVVSAAGLGCALFPILFHFLHDIFTWREIFFFLSPLPLNVSAGTAFRLVDRRRGRRGGESSGRWCERSLFLLSVFCAAAGLGYQVLVVPGEMRRSVSYASIFLAGLFAGRVLATSRCPRTPAWVVCLAASLLLPLPLVARRFFRHRPVLVASSFAAGTLSGLQIAAQGLAISEIFEKEQRHGTQLGYFALLGTGVALGPCAKIFVGDYHHFLPSFMVVWLAGAHLLAGAILGCSVAVARCRGRCQIFD